LQRRLISFVKPSAHTKKHSRGSLILGCLSRAAGLAHALAPIGRAARLTFPIHRNTPRQRRVGLLGRVFERSRGLHGRPTPHPQSLWARPCPCSRMLRQFAVSSKCPRCMGRVAGCSLSSPTPESERSATSIESLDSPTHSFWLECAGPGCQSRPHNTATAPGVAHTIHGWLLVRSPKIGYRPRKMWPVAEKTQIDAGLAHAPAPNGRVKLGATGACQAQEPYHPSGNRMIFTSSTDSSIWPIELIESVGSLEFGISQRSLCSCGTPVRTGSAVRVCDTRQPHEQEIRWR
jgi:hypothetical protein